MNPEFWPAVTQIVAWGIAFAWCSKTNDLIRGLPSVPVISSMDWKDAPVDGPSLVVVVPAKNEAAAIEATLESLMQQEYRNLRVIAVNDRSTDDTGVMMERVAARFPERLQVLHITQLQPGWLGKTHAMAQAVLATESEYILFTDGDVLFSPSILRRSMAYAVESRADHLVTVPTMQVKTWGEGVVLGFFQIFGLWASRPWKVEDPKAKRDIVGIGAFNLLRREALAGIGGLAPQRLAVLEDITLARRVKVAGLRQRVAFAPGLVLVHWAAGANGLMKVMSKNLFSAFNFRSLLALGACVWIAVFCLGPIAAFGWWWTMLPGALVLVCIAVTYRQYAEVSWIPAKYGWAYPLGAVMFCYAIARSVVTVWNDRGVRWRGTVYPLRELRRHNSPLQWK